MSLDLEKQLLEERKVKAIEKIAKILDNLTLWFEEVDKEEWGERIQYYLSEFLAKKEETTKEETTKEEETKE